MIMNHRAVCKVNLIHFAVRYASDKSADAVFCYRHFLKRKTDRAKRDVCNDLIFRGGDYIKACVCLWLGVRINKIAHAGISHGEGAVRKGRDTGWVIIRRWYECPCLDERF